MQVVVEFHKFLFSLFQLFGEFGLFFYAVNDLLILAFDIFFEFFRLVIFLIFENADLFFEELNLWVEIALFLEKTLADSLLFEEFFVFGLEFLLNLWDFESELLNFEGFEGELIGKRVDFFLSFPDFFLGFNLMFLGFWEFIPDFFEFKSFEWKVIVEKFNLIDSSPYIICILHLKGLIFGV